MEKEFKTREDVIQALTEEFQEKPAGFSYNKTATRFWTFNRLIHYYWDLKQGRTQTFRTQLNTETGYYELKSKLSYE
jgi:hypothetical protein